jgi:hypothetical protein
VPAALVAVFNARPPFIGKFEQSTRRTTMHDPFIFNSDVSVIDLKDAIHSRISKAKAILTCVMFASEFVRDDMTMDDHAVYHALWAADDYLEELDMLFQRLEEIQIH